MNNLAKVCLVGLGVGGYYIRCLVILYHLYFFCNTVSPVRYSFVSYRRRESNKMHQGKNYQNFSKWWEGVFLGNSFLIEWIWGFSPKFCNFIPPTIRHKRVLLVYPAAEFDNTYWHSGQTSYNKILARPEHF